MKASLKKPYALVLLATLLLSVTATVLRTVLLFTSFDGALGYFKEGALADLLFPLLFVIAAILYAAFGFLARTELDKSERKNTIPVTFASAFAAITVAVWFFTHLSLAFSAESAAERIFCILMLLFSIGLALHFVLSALDTGSPTLRVLAGVCAILFCVFYILYAYFNSALVLNSPIKIFDQLTVMVFALFFIVECRFSFGTAHNAVYLPVAMLATTFAAANSVPALLYALKEGKALTGNVMHDFMTFALCLYAATRLLAALDLGKNEDVRGEYADEIDRSNEDRYRPDVDTHIVPFDPDQQAFDFDGEDEDGATDGASEGGTSENADASDASDESDASDSTGDDNAETTLDFKRHF